MYLLFKTVDDRTRGPIEKVGRWMEYQVGYIPDTHVDIIPYEHLNARILENEDVAYAYIFMDGYRGHVSVRDGTPQNIRLNIIASEEATGTKVTYNLTEDDIANTVTFMKHIMRHKLDDVYDKRIIQQRITVSSLEQDSWAQQRAEAEAYTADNSASVPLLTALASARSITLAEMVTKVNNAISAYNTSVQTLLAAKQAVETEIKACASIGDCCRLMHNRFQIEMSLAQQEAEGDTSDPTYNI